MKTTFNKKTYFLGFLVLFAIECLIAYFIKDRFVRPYLGDFLVVIMIYCFLMAVSRLSVSKGLIIVLIFSYAVEFLQLINIAQVMQYQPPEVVMIILGSNFSWGDILAYSLGGLLIYGIEKFYPVNS